MKAENMRKRAEYETSLNTIEQSLQEVEEKYADNQRQEDNA